MPDIIKLMDAGMTMARFNMSHGKPKVRSTVFEWYIADEGRHISLTRYYLNSLMTYDD